jgi:toxin secretion/phage lysis holin
MDLTLTVDINPVAVAWRNATYIIFSVLILLMTLDMVTGVLVAWAQGKVSSKVSREGVTRKLLSILLIAAIALAKLTLVQMQPELKEIPIIFFACLGFVVTEFISIVENTAKLGVKSPMAARLAQALQQSAEQGAGLPPGGSGTDSAS